MGIVSKFLKFNGTVISGGVAFTCYQYPELRKEPGQLLHAMVRGGRCGLTGIRMAVDYLSCKEIGPQTHDVAS